MFRNRMIVSYRAFSCSVRGPQRNDCVWLYVELYSIWFSMGGMCLVTCSNVQYMTRNKKSHMFKCTWFTSHIYQNTLDLEWPVTLYLDGWSRDNAVGIGTRLRAGRLGVRIQAVAVDFYFRKGLSIGLGPI
jgi:hypothetical protein